MPKIIVEIEYDQPDDPYWMNPDNVAICLNSHCVNSNFKVKWAENGDPWRKAQSDLLDKEDTELMKDALREIQAKQKHDWFSHPDYNKAYQNWFICMKCRREHQSKVIPSVLPNDECGME